MGDKWLAHLFFVIDKPPKAVNIKVNIQLTAKRGLCGGFCSVNCVIDNGGSIC
jgi:hypothetical protein